jgi:hypothetical protein
VVAQRPDGSTEPLIWIEKFNPRFNTTYYFHNALTFPAGTKIEIMPETGSVSLVVRAHSPHGQKHSTAKGAKENQQLTAEARRRGEDLKN